jgi:MFS family permease
MSREGEAFEEAAEDRPSRLRQMPLTIWMLGLTSLFMDMSTEIVASLLPLFMVSVLGAPVSVVGLIDGIAEATASFTKILSGAFSDHLGRRKALALAGYGFSAMAKPLFPLAAGLWPVFIARFLDRVGKGVRGAPRDALIADTVAPKLRGAAYGLRQALDTLGALAAPLIAVGLMELLAGNFRLVFWLACLPALFSVLTLGFGVREPKRARPAERRPFPLLPSELVRLGRGFWLLTGVILLLLLPRFSEWFLLLRAANVGLPAAWVPLVMAAMNLVYAPVSLPAGKLSDRFGRRRMIFAGFAILVLAQLLLCAADRPSLVFAGALLWGLHYGLTQGALSALIADAAPKELRGTAFGVFHLVSGFGALIGSAGAGFIWDAEGPAVSFLAAAGVGVIGLVALVAVRPRG